MTDGPQNPEEGSVTSNENPEQAAALNADGSVAPTEEQTPAPVSTEAVLVSAAAPSAQPTAELPSDAQPTAEVPPTGQPQYATAPGSAHTGEAFKPAPKRPAAVGLVAVGLVAALIGGVSGAGVTFWATSNNASTPVVGNANPATVTVNNTTDVTQITAVAAKATPSVVTINVASSSAGGTGSGVVLSADGYILTNTHVVTLDGAVASPTVTVTTSDGRLLKATVVGTDPISDLAVIKVDASDLTPAEFADSSKLNVGDTAIAIGAPLGLAGTVTNGIVSALNRSITIASSAAPAPSSGDDQTTPDQGEQGTNPYDFFNFDIPGQTPSASSSSTISLAVIQTDAAINPGNSGGALLDAAGKVIGINVAIASAGSGTSGESGNIGVGFAIPSTVAQRIAKEIIDSGTATHGLLGATVGDATADTSAVVGASIQDVTAGGAAASGGLKAGDVITQFNGIPITGKTDLTAQVRAVAAGSKATVVYVRDGKAAQVEVTLGSL